MDAPLFGTYESVRVNRQYNQRCGGTVPKNSAFKAGDCGKIKILQRISHGQVIDSIVRVISSNVFYQLIVV